MSLHSYSVPYNIFSLRYTHLKKKTSLNSEVCFLFQLKIVSGGDGKCVAELKVEEEHQNYGGTLHGGMTATIVDIISTLGMMTHEKVTSPGVTVDLHVS